MTETPEKVEEAKTGGAKTADEDREIGVVSWRIYGAYLQAMGGLWFSLTVAMLLVLTQVATLGNSLFLGYWSGSQIKGFTTGQYMAVYAGMSTLFAHREESD